jgi:hypothetical protein
MKGKHTGENIPNLTTDFIEKLDIDEKIYRIITDNASNMMKTFKFELIVAQADGENGELYESDSIRSEEYTFDTQ